MPPSDGSRAKVTDTHGPFEVGAFSVCHAGAQTALHLSTQRGRFIFHMGRGGFLAAIDAAGDRPMRQDRGERPEPPAAVEERSDDRIDPRTFIDDSARREEVFISKRARYVAAHRDALAGKFRSLRHACTHHGVTYQSAYAWLRNNADSVAREIAEQDQAPLLKPSGRIL